MLTADIISNQSCSDTQTRFRYTTWHQYSLWGLPTNREQPNYRWRSQHPCCWGVPRLAPIALHKLTPLSLWKTNVFRVNFDPKSRGYTYPETRWYLTCKYVSQLHMPTKKGGDVLTTVTMTIPRRLSSKF